MTLALYRAYRPGSLAEVVGQDHVTDPLKRALSTGRIHHAYLFSGPRGCGKTSTARILARSLNCDQGPTPDPCGECDSCRDLAPNGPGSEDVIELDAASHGGVDDTRELRDRVIYTPARSRYRIYIIDEAHMVTTQGFNALLKVIEEPPEYVRFIFATTEPDKVLGTIRSRTFNYSFRLVAAGVLAGHLAGVCEAESVPFDEKALLLVAKAGGGSVRDALSILGQLIAGSSDTGLTYEYVSSALGVTDAVLLDSVVAAIAGRDGAAAFAAVDSVLESGHDPRRFLTDLLQRMRDLIVLRHIDPEQRSALLELPADQVDALVAQGDLFGTAELSRAADLVSAGLTELKGATAPRLQLELLLARLLLPAADAGSEGFAARLERVERQVAAGVLHQERSPRPTAVEPQPEPKPEPRPEPKVSARTASVPKPPPPPKPVPRSVPAPPPKLAVVAPSTASDSGAPRPEAEPSSASGASIDQVRRAWPAVLERVGKESRVAWALWDASQPQQLADGRLTVAVVDQGRLTSIKGGRRDELLRQALIDVAGLDFTIEPVLAKPGGSTAVAADEGATEDDPDLSSNELNGADLVVKELGGVTIGKIGDA